MTGIRINKFHILCILTLMFSTIYAGTQNIEKSWEYSRTISGIKIFHRAGKSDGLFEFLAITSINSPSGPITSAVLDIPSNRYWMADCVYSGEVARISTSEIIAYYITAPPWPVSRRDSLIRIKTSEDAGRRIFTLRSLKRGDAEKYKSVNPDYVRIYEMEGTVTLEEINPSLTEIRFSVAGESGGYVPDFIVRMGGWVIPYKTLSGLKKYINSSFPKK